MDEMRYVQAVSRLRAIETKLLDRAKIDRMIESNSADEVLKMLQETEYGTLMGNVKKPEDYEIVLSEELKRLYALMYSISPDKILVDIMSIRHDYHNIKVILKGIALNNDLDYLLIDVGTVPVSKLKEFIVDKNYYDLNPIMREAVEKCVASFEENKDPQKIDIIIDSYMYKDILGKAKLVDSKFLLKYLNATIDLTNIKTLLRIKKQNKSRDFLESVLIEGGTIGKDEIISMLSEANENILTKLAHTDYIEVLKQGIDEFSQKGSLKTFEKLSDNFIMGIIKNAKYVSFGVEPLIAYIFAKESEIKVVRIIMVGKLNNINAEVIRERLRDIYV